MENVIYVPYCCKQIFFEFINDVIILQFCELLGCETGRILYFYCKELEQLM